jgi:hypothetical protein
MKVFRNQLAGHIRVPLGAMTGSRRALGRLLATFAAALALAVPAFAATPSEIYKDYADNGRLDANYSKAELRRALQDATVQGYGSPVVVTKMKQKSRPTGGVKGKRTPPRGVQKERGRLPFTGAELGLFMFVSLALVGAGALLRLTGRRRAGAAP